MNETCECGTKTLLARPLKFIPDDKFATYKRKAKLNDYAKRGFL